MGFSGRSAACATAIEARDGPAPVYTAASNGGFAAFRSDRSCPSANFCLVEEQQGRLCSCRQVNGVQGELERDKLRPLRVKMKPKRNPRFASTETLMMLSQGQTSGVESWEVNKLLNFEVTSDRVVKPKAPVQLVVGLMVIILGVF